MKNFLSIALLSAIFFSFFGCEKDELETKQSEKYDEVTQSIINFKANMDKKSTFSDPISPDSLVWYIEATFNMYYGHPGIYHDIKETDSLLVSVDLIDGCEISPEDVYASYVTVNNFFCDEYESFKYDPKELVVMDLKLVGATETVADIMVYITIGRPEQENKQLKTAGSNPFETYDWWNAIDPGRCNGYNTSYPSIENAMDQLEKYYITHNEAFEYLDLTKVYDYYFTNIVTPVDPFYGAEGGDYSVFIWDAGDYTYCISPTDMNYFLQHIDEVIIDENPYTGKKPFNLDVIHEQLTGKLDLHAYKANYGTYHWSPFPALGEPSRL